MKSKRRSGARARIASTTAPICVLELLVVDAGRPRARRRCRARTPAGSPRRRSRARRVDLRTRGRSRDPAPAACGCDSADSPVRRSAHPIAARQASRHHRHRCTGRRIPTASCTRAMNGGCSPRRGPLAEPVGGELCVRVLAEPADRRPFAVRGERRDRDAEPLLAREELVDPVAVRRAGVEAERRRRRATHPLRSPARWPKWLRGESSPSPSPSLGARSRRRS